MNLRFKVAIPLVLLLSGCAQLIVPEERRAPLIKPPASAEEALLISGDLERRGRWSAALRVLDVAIKKYPESGKLPDARQRLSDRWAYERQLIEDRIMADDAENQQFKISQLERLSLAEPESLIVTSRRIFWKESLTAKAERLTRCGETYAKAEPALAKRCFEVASGLNLPEAMEQRLTAVGASLRAGETAAVKQRQRRARKVRQARAKVLLGEARRAIDELDYRRALDVLERLKKLQPENAEAEGLQEQAQSMISPQVEALIKLGDHLYLDEQLEAASATWSAALDLRPDDPEIEARIERAKSVIQRLRSLRERQRSGTPITR